MRGKFNKLIPSGYLKSQNERMKRKFYNSSRGRGILITVKIMSRGIQ